jgi:NAD(P)-dependent dehydrogenase (short-subunit alcohol dehydrogenase family)
LRALAKEIRDGGGTALVCTCDVTNRKSIDRAVARTVKEFRRIDVVVANAGFFVSGLFEKLETNDFRRQFETNFFGVVDTISATLPYLKKTKGRLAIVSSVAGRIATPAASAYCSSKFALNGLAETLYLELARFDVSVTLVLPGFVATEIGQVNNEGVFDPGKESLIPSWLAVSPEDAAGEVVDALYRRRFEAVVSTHGKLLAAFGRYFPHMTRLSQRLGANQVIGVVEEMRRKPARSRKKKAKS